MLYLRLESFNKKAKANEPEKGTKLLSRMSSENIRYLSSYTASAPGRHDNSGSTHTAVALTAAQMFPLELAQSTERR